MSRIFARTLATGALALSLSSPLAAESFESEQNFRAAMTAFKEKNFYSARLLLQEIVLKDGRGEYGDDAQYYLAMSYFYEGDYKTAQFEFKVLQRDFPESPFVPRAAFWNGEAWFYRKAYREALESHAAYVRKYRENILSASALYTTGYIYNEQKRFDEAVEALTRALKDYPASTAAPALTLQLGIAHFNAQDYPAARRQFETLMVKYTEADNLDMARFWLGKSYYAEGKYPAALGEFGKLVNDYPASTQASEALYLSALCHYKSGKTPEAMAALEAVAAKYPKSDIYPFARLRQAQLYRETGDLMPALAPLLDIIHNHRNHETFAPALQLMGEIRRKQGKPAEALAAFAALLNEKDLKGKARRETLRLYGDLLYQEGKLEKATAVYTDLTEEFGEADDGATYYLLLARAQYKDGKYAAADTTLMRLEKNFDDAATKAEALFLKAEIAFALGKFTQALQLYARMAKRFPDHAKAYDAELGIGWTYFELKQYARAGDHFRKLLRNYKKPLEQAKALIALGACQYNLRDLDGALASYRKVTKTLAGEKTEAAEAQYQIAWLLFRRNQPEEADKAFTDYLNRGEWARRAAEARYFSGLCKFQAANYAAAVPQFEQVYSSSLSPVWLREKALADLARTKAALKDRRAARGDYLKLLNEFPETQNRDEVEYQLVSLSLKLDDAATAEEWAGSLRERNRKSAWFAECLRELMDYYRRRKDFAAAEKNLAELEKSREKKSEKLDAKVYKAQLFIDRGQNDEASQLIRSVLQNEDVDEATALRAASLLFQMLEKAGNYEEIELTAEKLSERFADNARLSTEMLLTQARSLQSRKKFRDSREILTTLVKNRSAGGRARFLIAESYRHEGDINRALDYYRQVQQKDDEAAYLRARFHIGEILFSRKEYEEAAREFSRIAYADTRDDSVYEQALFRAALAFRRIKKQREFETFRAKLAEAFPQSAYLKELE